MKSFFKPYAKYCLMAIALGFICQGMKAELPSQDDRVYTLSKIWQELNYTFADAQRYNAVNVDSLYKAYIPLVSEIEDEFEYYQILSTFLANFREGHTRIIPPSDTPYDYPKLDIERLDNVIYISDTSESLSADIPRFSQILKVEGIDAYTYLTHEVVPTINASTDRWRLDKGAIQLLYGKPDTDVTITILTPEGQKKELKLLRNAKKDASPMLNSVPTMDFKWLNDSILYMSLNTCMDVQGARQRFLSHLNEINAAKGIVIDVRKNRGGTEEAWYMPVFLTLNMEQISYKGHDIRRTTSPKEDNSEPDFSNGTNELIHMLYTFNNGIPAEYRIDTPLVMLSGKCTGSAAEFFVQIMRENHLNLKVIGEPTVGSASIPKFVPLPEDYTLMIAQALYCDGDGNLPNHTGIIPDETIYLTYEHVLKGEDPALDRAIELLSQSI